MMGPRGQWPPITGRLLPVFSDKQQRGLCPWQAKLPDVNPDEHNQLECPMTRKAVRNDANLPRNPREMAQALIDRAEC